MVRDSHPWWLPIPPGLSRFCQQRCSRAQHLPHPGVHASTRGLTTRLHAGGCPGTPASPSASFTSARDPAEPASSTRTLKGLKIEEVGKKNNNNMCLITVIHPPQPLFGRAWGWRMFGGSCYGE